MKNKLKKEKLPNLPKVKRFQKRFFEIVEKEKLTEAEKAILVYSLKFIRFRISFLETDKFIRPPDPDTLSEFFDEKEIKALNRALLYKKPKLIVPRPLSDLEELRKKILSRR